MEEIFDDAVKIAMPKIKAIFERTATDMESSVEIPDETTSELKGESSTKNSVEMNTIKTEEPMTAVNVANQTQTTIDPTQTTTVKNSEKTSIFTSENLFKILRYVCLMIALAIMRSAFNYYTSFQENRFNKDPSLQIIHYPAPIPGGVNPYIHIGRPSAIMNEDSLKSIAG